MKKKLTLITALALVVVMAVGGTLAFFTDVDNAKNTFTVGNLDIKVTENGDDTDGLDFENAMPTDAFEKLAKVHNYSSEDAYVRVVVRVDNQEEIYKVLDMTDADDNPVYNVGDIFKGWDFQFEKDAGGMRYTSTRTPGVDNNYTSTGVELIAVDEIIASFGGGNSLISADNYFLSAAEQATVDKDTANMPSGWSMSGDNRIQAHHNSMGDNRLNEIYYQEVGGLYMKDSCVGWIFYLKMPKTSDYTLFEGLIAPASFTQEEMKMFDNLHIEIYADAIQSTGFADAHAAFEALNEAHPLSAWNMNE